MSDLKICDGGMGMYLSNTSVFGAEDLLWGSGLVYSDPTAVKKVHHEYIRSGARVITTCTYQASVQSFSKNFNLDESTARAAIGKSVKIARDAASDIGLSEEVTVVASIGSFGAHLCDRSEYTGSFTSNYSLDLIRLWHADQVSCFGSCASDTPDIIAFETIPVLREAEIILTVMEDHRALPFYISFCCNSHNSLSSGEFFRTAVKMCVDRKLPNLLGIGINCTPACYVTSLLTSCADLRLENGGQAVFLVMPNIRENMDITGSDLTNDVTVWDNVQEWVQLGVKFIGGCCGVEPIHIQKLHEILMK